MMVHLPGGNAHFCTKTSGIRQQKLYLARFSTTVLFAALPDLIATLHVIQPSHQGGDEILSLVVGYWRQSLQQQCREVVWNREPRLLLQNPVPIARHGGQSKLFVQTWSCLVSG